MTNETDYFYCYSFQLKRFIRDHGIKWVDRGTNNNNGRPYWMFEQTTALGRIIEEYKRNQVLS